MLENQLNSYTALRVWYYNLDDAKKSDERMLTAMCPQYLTIATLGDEGKFIDEVKARLQDANKALAFMQSIMKASVLGDISVRVINTIQLFSQLIAVGAVTDEEAEKLINAFVAADLEQWTIYENKYFNYYMQVLHQFVQLTAEIDERRVI